MAAPVFRWGGGGAVAGLRRCLSRRAVHHASVPTEMAAWQIHRYGGTEELQVGLDTLIRLRWADMPGCDLLCCVGARCQELMSVSFTHQTGD